MPHADYSVLASHDTKSRSEAPVLHARGTRRHAVNAVIGVALCYGVLLLAAELNTAPVDKPSTEPVSARTAFEVRDAERWKVDAAPDTEIAEPDAVLVTAGVERSAAENAAPTQDEPLEAPRDHLAVLTHAFDEQRLRAMRYRQALDAARQDVAILKAASTEMAAANTASVAGINRDLMAEQQKVQALESRLAVQDQAGRELLQEVANERDAALRERSIARAAEQQAEDALQLSEQRNAELDRKAQAAQRKLEQSLSLALAGQDARQQESEKLAALGRDLLVAQDEIKMLADRLEQSIRAAGVDRMALQRETERASGLARDLRAARAQIQRLSSRASRKLVRAEPAAQAVVPGKGSARVQRKPDTMKTSTGRVARTPDFLPTSLLPTRPPLRN